MTTQPVTRQNSSSSSGFLRRALQLDALTCLVGAIGFLAVSINPLARITGFTAPALPLVIAAALLIYAGWLFWLTKRLDTPRRQATIAIVVNDCWIVGWLAVLIFNVLALTLPGKLLVGLTIIVVALCTALELYALSKPRTE